MIINKQKDESLLFCDSNIIIIPLDRNFETASCEADVFVSIYNSSYSECKRDYLLNRDKKFFMYSIGKGRSVLYINTLSASDYDIKETVSLISRQLKRSSSNPSISILKSDLTKRFEEVFSITVNTVDLITYSKVLC